VQAHDFVVDGSNIPGVLQRADKHRRHRCQKLDHVNDDFFAVRVFV
jgi:hypothetical protein